MKRHNALSIESLENREMMAGDVLAAINSAGDLIVTGDNADNEVEVRHLSNGQYRVTGLDGTDIHLDSWNSPGQSSVDLPGGINHLKVYANGGDDIIDIVGRRSSYQRTAKDVQVYLGAGDDLVDVREAWARDDIRLYGDGGSDTAYVRDTNVGFSNDPSNSYLEAFGFEGQGRNGVTVADSSIEHYLNIDSRDGDRDTIISLSSVYVGQDLTVTTGDGNEQISLFGVYVGDDATFDTGTWGNDRISIRSSQVGDRLSVDMGNNNDVLTLTDFSAKSGTLVGGAHYDNLDFFGNVQFEDGFTEDFEY